MAQVTITHIDRGLPLGLPYLVLVDGRPIFRFRVTHTDTPPEVVHPSELQKKILEYQQKQMRR